MSKERLIEIIREFYGDMKLSEPYDEIRETIQSLNITKEEIEELELPSMLGYL
ncbi:MAG: hypothetical protein Q4E61_01260 [Alphaproteobacteria bacterium]|nr:hypothetical protein [Alphaproteobacteria bacterium]